MSRLIERHRITHFGSAPTLIRGMASNAAVALQGDVSTVRLLITAGEGIDPEHFTWFQRHFGRGTQPLINYTGGTEVSGALLSSVVVRPIPPSGFNTTSPGVDVDVVDPEGRPLTGAVGELVVRRPFVGMTLSFWHDDERYLDTYWRTIPGLWVHGDLAVRRADGNFFMMGRSDDTHQGRGQAPRTGGGRGDRARAAERRRGGRDRRRRSGQGAEAGRLRGAAPRRERGRRRSEAARHARTSTSGMGRPFRPRRVHVVAQLPKTRSSKIMRRVIRSVYSNLPPGDLSSLDNPAALDEIRAAAAA